MTDTRPEVIKRADCIYINAPSPVLLRPQSMKLAHDQAEALRDDLVQAFPDLSADELKDLVDALNLADDRHPLSEREAALREKLASRRRAILLAKAGEGV